MPVDPNENFPPVLDKPDFREAHRRMEAWWAGASLGRPAVAARVQKPAMPLAYVDPRPQSVREYDLEYIVQFGKFLLDTGIYLGEAMPEAFPRFGNQVVLLSMLIGGRVDYKTEMTWMLPMAGVYEKTLPPFSPEHPLIRLLSKALFELNRVVGSRGLLCAPSLLDGITTLSMLRGPEQLCYDMLERPDDVKRVSDHLTTMYIEVHRYFWNMLVELGHPQSVSWCNIYAPGRSEMVQCDFGPMISADMFEEFVMPDLRRTVDYFDYPCYHLDGTCQTRFFKQLCTMPNLNAIHWNPEPEQANPLEWMDFFKAVRKNHLSLWIQADSPETACELTRELGPDGLMLFTPFVRTPAEFDRLLTALTEASGQHRS